MEFKTLLVVFIQVKVCSAVQEVNVLAMEQRDSFGVSKLPAIFMGIEKINEIYNETFHINLLRTTFGPMCSPNGKGVAFSDVYNQNRLDATFGPSCSSSVDPVGRMCASWNILIAITVGTDVMFDNQNDFPTLIRTSFSVGKLENFYSDFFRYYDWTDIAMIYDQDATSCSRWAEGIEPLLVSSGFRVTVVRMRSLATGKIEYTRSLNEASSVSRVFTICCHMDTFRELMIKAHALGKTDGDYMFLMMTRYDGDFFGNYSWYRGDENDDIAREAYSSAKMVKFRRSDSPEFLQFEYDLRIRAQAEFGHEYGIQVEPDTTLYYDLALIYGEILNETITEGGNFSDGRYLKSMIIGREFNGMSGQMVFDNIGALEPEYSVYDVDPATGHFRVFGNYFGYRRRLTLNNVTVNWGTNGPPVNKPFCGFTNENPACEQKPLNTMAIVVGSLLGVLVISIAIFLFTYKRIKRESELNSQWWRIKPEEISFHDKRINSMGSRKSQISMLRSTDDLREAGIITTEQCGIYQGAVVFMTKTNLKNINMMRSDLIELKQMREMLCGNLVKFIGLYHHEKHIYKVTEYCSRGSLQDIVQNNSMNLDWDFKAALLTDLTNGMAYLHESNIHVHGRLNSERCVIDSRFVLKITGFGLAFLRSDTPLKAVKNEHEMLWFAPEVLRGNCKVSQASDVYSYAILLFEILSRMTPFEMDLDLLTTKEVITKIKTAGNQIPFRPQLPDDVDHLEVVQLMKECWDEHVFKRPTFRVIKRRLKEITGISNSHNILDSLLRRMEQYANNLEDLVGQRTEAFLEEKRKAEELLDQVLPRTVATKLKNGQPVDPEAFQCVTIYFSDIVGFTSISAKSSPIQVVDLLNDLYTMFDGVIDSFDVYKVETIGDGYMVVSGLPQRNGDEHAREIAQMSLAILQEIRIFRIKHLPDLSLQARIGVHSGSVCAGVVGKKMPRYCLFGDTVNTASRMESHGQAMRIHVSPQAKALLDTFGIFFFECRGLVNIKGKGEMNTYWLQEDVKSVRTKTSKQVKDEPSGTVLQTGTVLHIESAEHKNKIDLSGVDIKSEALSVDLDRPLSKGSGSLVFGNPGRSESYVFSKTSEQLNGTANPSSRPASVNQLNGSANPSSRPTSVNQLNVAASPCQQSSRPTSVNHLVFDDIQA